MGSGDRAAIAAGIGGFGSAAASVALPMAYPDASVLIWQALAWAGVALMVVAGLFFVWEHAAEPFLRRRNSVVPPPTAPAEANTVTFGLNFTDPEHLDHTAELVIRAARPLTGVVVMGRFALPIHYLSGARWKWTLPVRLASQDLMTGEVIQVPYFARPAPEKGLDTVRALGLKVPLAWNDPDQGEMVRIQIVVHAADTTAEYDSVWQFRQASGKRFTDRLSFEGLCYPDDSLNLNPA